MDKIQSSSYELKLDTRFKKHGINQVRRRMIREEITLFVYQDKTKRRNSAATGYNKAKRKILRMRNERRVHSKNMIQQSDMIEFVKSHVQEREGSSIGKRRHQRACNAR
jgi:hypothetical protein